MLYTLRFFFSSKCSLFHNANLFGFCIIHILFTGCAEIKKKNNSGAKGLKVLDWCSGLEYDAFCLCYSGNSCGAAVAYLACEDVVLDALVFLFYTGIISGAFVQRL